MNNMFSNKGLTSSEANHITNVTKEIVKSLSSIDNLKLFTSTVIKGITEYPLDENTKKEEWVKEVQRVGELYALSAWLKSAVKLKEKMLDDITFTSYQSKESLVLEPYPTEPNVTFEDYLDTLTIKERAEYLSNESIASHIGKFVHNFDSIRIASDNFTPTTFQQLQNEVVTVENTRLYSKQELADGFFELQKQHRESEKIVNLYKSRHKEWVKSVLDNYSEERKAIAFKNAELKNTFLQKEEKERLGFEAEKREKLKEVSNLKIEIPNDLQIILDYVNQYAKK